MFKVSVIVPVYNTRKYLRECLRSLEKQTIDSIEIIMVNDGSTDESITIMEEFVRKYPDRFVLINKENGGQATARNMGIQESHGEYIGFVDSDDKVDKNMFQKMYQAASCGDYDYVECHYHYVEEQKDGSLKELETRGNIRAYKNKKDMFIDPQVSPWNKLYKRELLIDNEIKFPEGVIYEDTSFFIKSIPYINKAKYLDEKLVYYYLHSNSTMNKNKSVKVADIFKVLEDYLKFYKDRELYEEYKEELEYFTTKIILCSSLSRIGRVTDKDLKKQLLDKSFEFINKWFPNYKNNRYYTGKIGKYIRIVNRRNSSIISTVLGKVMKG